MDVGATTVIVMDATKEFKRKFEHPNKNLQLKQNNPSSPEEIMHYWLNAFYAEAKEKKTNIINNIFIVLTHTDMFDTEIEKEKKKRYKRQIMKSLKEKTYRCLITKDKIFAVDNKTGKDESFDELKKCLFNSFDQQQSWGKPMPMKWLQLQAEILEEKEKGTGYMHFTKLSELGRSVGNDTDIQSFLTIHHAVGTFLHFVEKPQETIEQLIDLPELNYFIVTDPQWLVNKCKDVITHPEFLGQNKSLQLHTLEELQKGCVTQNSLEHLWGRSAAGYLTKLMLAFDIFIPISESKEFSQFYLIPCLLPEKNKNQIQPKLQHGVCLYSVIRKAAGDWFQAGVFDKLIASFVRKNWKLCEDPSYASVSFTSGKYYSLQLLLEDNPNVRVVMYCRNAGIRDEEKKSQTVEILEETRNFVSDKTRPIDINKPEDIYLRCKYNSLERKGLDKYPHAWGFLDQEMPS